MKEVIVYSYQDMDFGFVFRSSDASGNSVGNFFTKESDAKEWATDKGYKVVETFTPESELIKEKFTKELKELLKKYDVEISFDYSDSSDTHGIYNPNILFESKTNNFKKSVNGYGVSSSDLK